MLQYLQKRAPPSNAVCCSMLQCVAVSCSTRNNLPLHQMQCVAVCCSVLQCVAVCCSTRNNLPFHQMQCLFTRGEISKANKRNASRLVSSLVLGDMTVQYCSCDVCGYVCVCERECVYVCEKKRVCERVCMFKVHKCSAF